MADGKTRRAPQLADIVDRIGLWAGAVRRELGKGG